MLVMEIKEIMVKKDASPRTAVVLLVILALSSLVYGYFLVTECFSIDRVWQNGVVIALYWLLYFGIFWFFMPERITGQYSKTSILLSSALFALIPTVVPLFFLAGAYIKLTPVC